MDSDGKVIYFYGTFYPAKAKMTSSKVSIFYSPEQIRVIADEIGRRGRQQRQFIYSSYEHKFKKVGAILAAYLTDEDDFGGIGVITDPETVAMVGAQILANRANGRPDFGLSPYLGMRPVRNKQRKIVDLLDPTIFHIAVVKNPDNGDRGTWILHSDTAARPFYENFAQYMHSGRIKYINDLDRIAIDTLNLDCRFVTNPDGSGTGEDIMFYTLHGENESEKHVQAFTTRAVGQEIALFSSALPIDPTKPLEESPLVHLAEDRTSNDSTKIAAASQILSTSDSKQPLYVEVEVYDPNAASPPEANLLLNKTAENLEKSSETPISSDLPAETLPAESETLLSASSAAASSEETKTEFNSITINGESENSISTSDNQACETLESMSSVGGSAPAADAIPVAPVGGVGQLASGTPAPAANVTSASISAQGGNSAPSGEVLPPVTAAGSNPFSSKPIDTPASQAQDNMEVDQSNSFTAPRTLPHQADNGNAGQKRTGGVTDAADTGAPVAKKRATNATDASGMPVAAEAAETTSITVADAVMKEMVAKMAALEKFQAETLEAQKREQEAREKAQLEDAQKKLSAFQDMRDPYNQNLAGVTSSVSKMLVEPATRAQGLELLDQMIVAKASAGKLFGQAPPSSILHKQIEAELDDSVSSRAPPHVSDAFGQNRFRPVSYNSVDELRRKYAESQGSNGFSVPLNPQIPQQQPTNSSTSASTGNSAKGQSSGFTLPIEQAFLPQNLKNDLVQHATKADLQYASAVFNGITLAPEADKEVLKTASSAEGLLEPEGGVSWDNMGTRKAVPPMQTIPGSNLQLAHATAILGKMRMDSMTLQAQIEQQQMRLSEQLAEAGMSGDQFNMEFEKDWSGSTSRGSAGRVVAAQRYTGGWASNEPREVRENYTHVRWIEPLVQNRSTIYDRPQHSKMRA